MKRKFLADDSNNYPNVGEKAFLLNSGNVSIDGPKYLGLVENVFEDDNNNIILEIDAPW